MPKTKTHFECLMSMPNLGKYVGKWIAVIDSEIIAGDVGKQVFEKAKQKYPDKEPLIMKVPEDMVMLM